MINLNVAIFQQGMITASFMPHGACYLWKPDLMGLHILSDLWIAIAYFSIPCTLIYFVRRRQDLPYPRIFLLFSAFIIACGITHLMAVWTLWHPNYWILGGIKALTALISVFTAYSIIPLVPKLLELRSPKELEEMNIALKASKHRYQTLLATCPVGIFEADVRGQCLYVNEYGCKITGMQASARLKGWADNVVPEDRNRVIEEWVTAVKNQEPFYSEYRLKTPEGNEFWLLGQAIPLRDEQGKVTGYLGTVLNINDRKKAEAGSQQSQQMLQLIINTIPQRVFWKDRNSVYAGCNQPVAEDMGLSSPEDIIGKTDYDLPLRLEEVEYYRKLDQEVMESDTPRYRIIETQFRADNQVCWIETNKIPLHDPQGNVVGILGTYENVTERKLAAELLNQQKRTLRAILDNAPIWIWMTGINGKMKLVNKTFCEDVGIPEEKFLQAAHYSEILGEKQSVNCMESDAVCWAQDTPHRFSESLQLVDGQWHDFDVLKAKVKDESGQVMGLIGLAVDITENKQAQLALEESEARFRQLAQQEKLINYLANQIRNSLDLNTILATTVWQVWEFMNVDRCYFCWYRYGGLNTDTFTAQLDEESFPSNFQNIPYWEVVTEAKNSSLFSLIGQYPLEEAESWPNKHLPFQISRVDDVEILPNSEIKSFVEGFGLTSLLALPIQTKVGEIGLLVCGNHEQKRHWTESEVELLKVVVDQVAIAINQAQLYEKSREAAALAKAQTLELEATLLKLKQAQAHLIQTEKMSSLGQLVAGVAHEINNPINFIYGNVNYANEYFEDLLNLIQVYQQSYPEPVEAVQDVLEDIELEFLQQDLPKLLNSMRAGASRIQQIVLSLRNFSRLEEVGVKQVDLHEGLENTLMILQNRLNEGAVLQEITVIKNYENLPLVECYASQINQVFMNLISNAIDALQERQLHYILPINWEIPSDWQPQLTISTALIDAKKVMIKIADNGIGMTTEVQSKLFDPFFTTKPVGKGTGLGLAISYQIIVERHHGELHCFSKLGEGSEFVIEIPIKQL